MNDACCNTPPTNAEWQPRGDEKVLAKINGQDRKVYRTGPKGSKRGIVAVHDPLGLHPTSLQVYDLVAESHGGFQLAAPHMFPEGGALPESLLGDLPSCLAWINENGDFKRNHMHDVILAAIEDLRADGCTTFSIFGQCWGAYVAVQAASQPESVFLATGGPHPSLMTIENVKDVKCPLILLASKDEADMIPVIDSVKHKNFPVESFQKRFDNVPHGWCSRGDWSDLEAHKAGLEVVDLLGEYFAKVAEVAEGDP